MEDLAFIKQSKPELAGLLNCGNRYYHIPKVNILWANVFVVILVTKRVNRKSRNIFKFNGITIQRTLTLQKHALSIKMKKYILSHILKH